MCRYPLFGRKKPPRRREADYDPKAGIAESTLYNQIKAFFQDCAKRLSEQNDAAGAARFSRVSTHWMRHTHASHAIAHGTPLEVARENLGHASIATTTIYVQTEAKKRMKAMQGFWRGQERGDAQKAV